MGSLGARAMNISARLALGATLLLLSSLGAVASSRDAARQALWKIFREESGWTKIHAAEALIGDGLSSAVREACQPFSAAPEAAGFPLIGYWRVMARCAPDERARWVAFIREKTENPEAPEWVFAVEALAKLSVTPDAAFAARLRRQMRVTEPSDALFAWWLLGGSTEAEGRAALLAGLKAADAKSRLRAAFILGEQRPGDEEIVSLIEQAAKAEPVNSAAFPYLAAAAAQWQPTKAGGWKARLEELVFSGSPAAVLPAARGLLRLPGRIPEEQLAPLLSSPAAPVRIAAALLLLKED